jgi:hypothetical protein
MIFFRRVFLIETRKKIIGSLWATRQVWGTPIALLHDDLQKWYPLPVRRQKEGNNPEEWVTRQRFRMDKNKYAHEACFTNRRYLCRYCVALATHPALGSEVYGRYNWCPIFSFGSRHCIQRSMVDFF